MNANKRLMTPMIILAGALLACLAFSAQAGENGGVEALTTPAAAGRGGDGHRREQQQDIRSAVREDYMRRQRPSPSLRPDLLLLPDADAQAVLHASARLLETVPPPAASCPQARCNSIVVE
ncbi:hypothetical protein U9M48_025226 [Paspalum notatum var. saurae]|uniref:Secreted protein n=1 Tax=Paspalum notatum var. saurae TaxID=547442 RepID=A0AAQ3TNX1_PASNO